MYKIPNLLLSLRIVIIYVDILTNYACVNDGKGRILHNSG